MPIPPEFAERLFPLLERIAGQVPTPFYVYDEAGIVATHRQVVSAFGDWPYRQHFAVKALPNPVILRRLLDEGSGLDCSSPLELELARCCGAPGEAIVFTSSNTTSVELGAARALGARITFDDIRYFDRLECLPDSICFRVAPPGDGYSALMGNAEDSKFGMAPNDLLAAYGAAKARGARRFGIYGMACANELETANAIAAARRLVAIARAIEAELGLTFDYMNFGGGIGIPYRPDEAPFDFAVYARELCEMTQAAFPGRRVEILTELGRFITGPHGVLVTRVVNRTVKRREMIGVDASMSCLARPALYGAYHHITAPLREDGPTGVADVVGSMCENGDRLATRRPLTLPDEGDLLLVHDAGAHAHALGITYNGRLRPAEVLLRADGDAALIRRAETPEDHLATCRDDPLLIAGAAPGSARAGARA